MNFTPPDKFAEEWKKRISDISNSEVKTSIMIAIGVAIITFLVVLFFGVWKLRTKDMLAPSVSDSHWCSYYNISFGVVLFFGAHSNGQTFLVVLFFGVNWKKVGCITVDMLAPSVNDSHWCSYYNIPGSSVLWSMETEDKSFAKPDWDAEKT
ncbi:unnamed protein product [Mytilus coruscus]|uniref:Uncharacterized protein n=1 Tax=Mytilus coruscus TaxID=42192 RepID=A0A6J8B919_MYTCO|nr:unnamed protein product [Mytilus coruscus]